MFRIKLEKDESSSLNHFYKSMDLYKFKTEVYKDLTTEDPVVYPIRSNTLLILSIPPHITAETINKFIETNSESKYFTSIYIKSTQNSCIIYFESQSAADTFYINSLGRCFDKSIPLCRCICMYLYDIIGDDLGFKPVIFPGDIDLTIDYKLPTCPICFQKLDQLKTLYFVPVIDDYVSSAAYQSWDSSCVVCAQQFNDHTRSCECGEEECLWICMDCGNVGCGRTKNKHAFKHYDSVGHRFYMNSSKYEIWDYSGDAYADRTLYKYDVEMRNRTGDLYRNSLKHFMNDVNNSFNAKLRETDEIDSIIEETMKQIQLLDSKIEDLTPEYEESLSIQEKSETLEKEISDMKSNPIRVKREKLLVSNKSLENNLKKTQEEIKKLSIMFEEADANKNIHVIGSNS